MDANEKDRCEQYKNMMYCFELILEASLHKTAVVWSLASHRTNHPNKTYETSIAGEVRIYS